MKTKNYHCLAMAAIAAGLMIFFSTAIPGRVQADDPPVKTFHADETYCSSTTWKGNIRATTEILSYECELLMTSVKEILTDGVLTSLNRKSYSYDINGVLLTELWEYDYEGDWYPERRLTYNYDGNGYISTVLIEFYDEDEEDWYPYNLNNYSYDEHGNLLLLLVQRYDWDEEDWVDTEKKIYEYNTEGLCISTTTQIYMDFMGGWINMGRGLYEYDENGFHIITTSQSWGFPNGPWKNSIITYFYYDSDGNYLYVLDQNASGVNFLKVDYTHEAGHITGLAYKWNTTSGEWVPGNAPIRMHLMVDGVKTEFPSLSGTIGEVFYSQDLYVEPSPYQTVYLGYPPAECAEVSATVTGGTEPYTYLWDNGETGESFVACPEESTTYTVLVTDDEGCTFEASTRVCVIDVRCGKNLDKVALCHCPPGNPNNCKTLCIGMDDVAEHLAHGDLLAPCGTDHNCTDFKTTPVEAIHTEYAEDMFLQAYPNPFETSTMISYRVSEPGQATIRLVNSTGQQVGTLYEGYTADGEIHQLQTNMEQLQPGMYICILQQADGSIVMQKIVVRR
ncbi:MAG: T9SS type A sorting domain-containing protein [Bacteroidales bacterium]|nr:T9SS type A sorting domain-containing protein [Bacteroidales bacterium]